MIHIVLNEVFWIRRLNFMPPHAVTFLAEPLIPVKH